jgi:hypothetical protein
MEATTEAVHAQSTVFYKLSNCMHLISTAMEVLAAERFPSFSGWLGADTRVQEQVQSTEL